ncbi:MAG TPA: hypothetical protein VGM90_05245 [Kofleriaceae bacterium]|jgi:hypothetical protein
MFNEILTGKATLEPKPPMGGPYREPEVPNEQRSCARCRHPFVVPATSAAQTCVSCQLSLAQASSPPANYNSYDYDLRPKRDYTFVYIRIAIAIIAMIVAAAGGYH